MEVSSPTLLFPQAKPMDPRRILPHPNISHPLVSPATQLTACGTHSERVEHPSRAACAVVPTVPVVSTSVLQHETPVSLLADPHPPSHLGSSPPFMCLLPPTPRRLGQFIAPLPRYDASYNHSEIWDPRPSCSTCFLHPSGGISRRVLLLERA